jgi:hypothetical protein
MAYDYAIGVMTALTGTFTTATSIGVFGSGTNFDGELLPGDYLNIGGEARIVNDVVSDTELTVTVAYGDNYTGLPATRVRLLNVETDLGLPAPRGIFTPYTQPVVLGNGLVRGAGWKTAEWRWGFITRAQRQTLRAYCAGASANVYIKTRTVDNSDAYVIYNANLIWPQQEEPQAGRRLDFILKFQGLVAWP